MDKEQNKEKVVRYRCFWCRYVMDEHLIILKDKSERDKYNGVELPEEYCKECWEYIQWENETYFN